MTSVQKSSQRHSQSGSLQCTDTYARSAAARRSFFNTRAARWDTYITEEQHRRIRRLVRRFDIKPGERVLDVGCGTGVLLPYLAELVGPTERVHALDFAPRMIAAARRKYGQQFVYTVADARHLPFPDGSFDVAVCYAVFPHFCDKSGTLAELHRVLAAGGRLFIAHTDSRRSINAFHRSVSGVVHDDHMPDTREMLSLLKSAGFIHVRVSDQPHAYLACGVVPRIHR